MPFKSKADRQANLKAYYKRNKKTKQAYDKKYRKRPEVKARRKLSTLKYEYGISSEAYRALVEAQDGKCKICDRERKLVVDHCHSSGKVRGLLCYSCNTSLGQFNDDPKLLIKAITYLKGEI